MTEALNTLCTENADLKAKNERLKKVLERIASMTQSFTGAKHEDNAQGREVLAIKSFAREALKDKQNVS